MFTLEGAEHAYRVLIESMNEGALTLTADKTILYANQCFARMVKCPLEQVIGGSFRRFLSAEDRAMLRPLMKRAATGHAQHARHASAAHGDSLRTVQGATAGDRHRAGSACRLAGAGRPRADAQAAGAFQIDADLHSTTILDQKRRGAAATERNKPAYGQACAAAADRDCSDTQTASR